MSFGWTCRVILAEGLGQHLFSVTLSWSLNSQFKFLQSSHVQYWSQCSQSLWINIYSVKFLFFLSQCMLWPSLPSIPHSTHREIHTYLPGTTSYLEYNDDSPTQEYFFFALWQCLFWKTVWELLLTMLLVIIESS